MATNEELSEQLSIMTKLNSVVERMARSVSSIEGSYETQINTLEKLTNVINSMNVDRTVTELGKISANLKEVVSGLNNLGSVSESSLGKLTTQSAKANTAATALASGLTGVAATIVAMSSKGTKGMSSVSDAVAESATKMQQFEKASDKVSKVVSGKFVKASALAVGALHGLSQGFRNIVALSKGVFGFTTSFVSALGNIAASIVAIPLKIFTGLVDMAAAAEGGGNELLQALENLRKEMGNLNTSGAQAVLQTTKTLKGFSDTGLSTWKVFGTLAERLELVTKVAVTMGATFGRVKAEFVENGGAILGFQKGLGITDEQMKAVGDRAITMGVTMSKTLLTITKQTLELGEAFDIDQKLIGKDIARAIVDVKHFGSVTVKEIGQASVYARKLGLELDKIVGTLDAFETFDSAAENAAKLSQSFGLTVDAFQLMEAQSPADQLEMLRKQFREGGVDASQFSRQQLKLLASTTGLDEATAKQAFSMSNQGISLDEIRKKSEKAEKKTLTQAEAMAKLADSIERLVKSGPGLTGSFFDMFVKGFLRGIQSTKEFREMIMFIKRDLMIAMHAGVQLGRTFANIFPGVKDFFGGIRDFFEPKRFKQLFDAINKTFTDFFHQVAEGKFSFPELMKKLQSTFFNFFNTSEPSGQRALKGLTDFFRSMARIIGQAIPWIAEQLGKGLQSIADFMKDPTEFLKKAQSGAQGGAGFVGKIVLPIVDGLKQAVSNPTLRKGFSDFVKIVGLRLKEVFESDAFRSVAKTVVAGLFTTLFAPAILHAGLAALTTKIGGAVIKQVSSVLFKKGGVGLAEKAGGAGLSKLAGAAGPIGALVAAAAAIGRGVNQYTDKITSTMDRSSKTIAAGATGIIDALTLGLLPDDFTTSIANTFAEVADGIFAGMESVFGVGFVNNMKRRLASTFEVFGGVYNFFAQLFTGDQASFESAAKELGLSLLRFATNSFEFMFIQLPVMVMKMALKIETLMKQMALKIGTAIVSLIAESIESISPTNLGLKEKANSIAQNMAKEIEKVSSVSTQALDKVSAEAAKATEQFNEKYLRSAEDRAKAAKAVAEKSAASAVAATKDASKKVEKSLSETLDDIKTAKEIKKELSGPGAVDIKKLMADVKDKLAGIDFRLLTDDQAKELAKTSEITESVQNSVSNVAGFFTSLAKLPESIKGATSALKKDAVKPALEAIQSMVNLANQLDTALSDGNLNKVDVKAKLMNIANSVGMGAKAQYTVTSKPVNITINMTVTMNAEDMEKALIMRNSSIIRDRLNFATGDDAGRKGSPAIPETQTSNLQKISAVD